MCNWHRVDTTQLPKDRPEDRYSSVVVVFDPAYPTQWFSGWYDFVNGYWHVVGINTSWRSITITHWASVELPVQTGV